MKILLAPSETKTTNGDNIFDLSSFSFKDLDRKTVVDKYRDTVLNGDKEVLSKMFGLKKESDIELYIKDIYTQPTKKAILRYSGVAFDYLGYPNLDKKAQKYIDSNVLIFSNLFGILKADDLIPNYKLKQGELVDEIRVDRFYKENLKDILDDYFKDEDILNLSANYYDKFYKPSKNYTTLKFLKDNRVVSHWAKAYRGLVLKAISEANISTTDELINLSIDGLSIKEIKTIKNRREIIYNL